jgi:adenylate cyclase
MHACRCSNFEALRQSGQSQILLNPLGKAFAIPSENRYSSGMNNPGAEPLEIERKFLIVSDGWRSLVEGSPKRLSQGYLCSDSRKSVRVRIAGERATVTVKGAREGITRLELQYDIPVRDAELMLALCERPLIDKTRYIVRHDGMKWEVDIFHAENEGLMVAEIELEREDQPVNLPYWVGQEVSNDARYYNSCLAKNPYSTWK